MKKTLLILGILTIFLVGIISYFIITGNDISVISLFQNRKNEDTVKVKLITHKAKSIPMEGTLNENDSKNEPTNETASEPVTDTENETEITEPADDVADETSSDPPSDTPTDTVDDAAVSTDPAAKEAEYNVVVEKNGKTIRIKGKSLFLDTFRNGDASFYFIDRVKNDGYSYDLLKNTLSHLVAVKGKPVEIMWFDDPKNFIYQTGYETGRDLIHIDKKANAAYLVLTNCNYGDISSDNTKLIASGMLDNKQKKRKLYLYSFKDRLLTEIPGASAPQTWDDIFSYTAGWSADSRHIYAMDDIVDTKTCRIIKNLQSKGAIISNRAWSPDGQKLAFMVQTEKSEKYYIELENSCIFLSDKIGIYRTKNNSIQYINLQGHLVKSFFWMDDSNTLVCDLIPLKNANNYIKYYGYEDTNPDHNSFVDIKLVRINFPITQTDLVSSYHANVNSKNLKTGIYYSYKLVGRSLFFKRVHDNKLVTSIYNLKTKKVIDMDEWPHPFLYDNKTFLLKADGLYRLTSDLQFKKIMTYDFSVFNHSSYLVFPNQRKFVFEKSDDQTDSEYIEIVDLKL